MSLYLRHALALVALSSLLAACSTPRGAGFQNEVLVASDETTADGKPIYDFAVYEVTRRVLPTVNAWPANGVQQYQWIMRQPQSRSLIIAPGDVLKITVWDAEENSLLTGPGERAAVLQDVRVGSNGRIFLPFVGEMKVSGMSPDTARAQIEARLSETVPSAQVQLSALPGRGNTANLVAGVQAPGVYPLVDQDMTILNLISEGGGPASELKNPQVKLIRGNDIFGISMDRLFSNPSFDTTLRGGDRVILEKDDRYFLSLGAAGSEAVHPFTKADVTALDALAIIGGVSEARADPQGILILREYEPSAVRPNGPPMERVIFTVDLTTADGLFSAGKFNIMPSDLVYVTESPISAASTILGVFSAALRISNQL
ncbi:MAG: polysaccharide export protein [Yoonia sp.]|nr:polysaccharide export protein [Yoonia sp.]